MSALSHVSHRRPLYFTFLAGWALVTLTLLVATLVDGHASLSVVLVFFLLAPFLPAAAAWGAVTGSGTNWLGAALLAGYAVLPLALDWTFVRVGRAGRIAQCFVMALWWVLYSWLMWEMVLSFPRS